MNAHTEFEQVMARTIRAANPVAALARAARDEGVSAECRAWLRAIDAKGFRVSALLVAKLRFERLVQGSELAAGWLEVDVESFAAAFKRYHAAVPATAYFPAAEARLFDRWFSKEGL